MAKVENKIQVFKSRHTSGTVYATAQRYAKTKNVQYMIHLDDWQLSGVICRKMDNQLYQQWPKNTVELSEDMIATLPKAIKTKLQALRK
jgi:hypothetical protein